jgi:hypothetical protein
MPTLVTGRIPGADCGIADKYPVCRDIFVIHRLLPRRSDERERNSVHGDPFGSVGRRLCRTGVIIRNILSERLDGINLRNVDLPGTIAHKSMTAAEISSD